MASIILNPTDDAYVRSYAPTSTYNNDELIAGTDQPDWLWIARSFLKFQIPASLGTPGNITSAILYLKVKFKWFYSDNTFRLEEVADFSETTVTWNTQPSILSNLAILDSGSIPGAGGWIAIDITSYIQLIGLAGFARFGCRVLPEPFTKFGPGTNLKFWSNDAPSNADLPYILLTFTNNLPVSSTATLAPQSGDKEKVNVSWTLNADTDFDKYEVYRAKDGGPFAMVMEEYVQSVVTWDDPDVLVDGSSYEYYIRTYDQYQSVDGPIVSMTKPEVIDFIVDDTAPIVSQTVTGTVSGTGGTINQWYFDWGDGSTGWVGTNQDTNIYSASGLYYTKARVRNSAGFESSLFDGPIINVQSSDPVPILVVQPVRANIGEEVIMNGGRSYDPDLDGGIDLFEFDPGTGSFTSNGLNTRFYVVFTSTGTKTLRLRVTDKDSNTAIVTVLIEVYAETIIDLDADLIFNAYLLKDTDKSIFYTEDACYKQDGVDLHRMSSGDTRINIGALVRCDTGLDDITLLESIRDDPDNQRVQITIDGQIYVGELLDIRIVPMRGMSQKHWGWKAVLKIDQPPGD